MTQLTLFADLIPGPTPASGPIPAPASVVVPVAVGSPKAEQADQEKTRPRVSGESNSLMQLAEMIRQGREQMQAQARRRSRPVQSIGDLAQAVLLRHDLVARRRARNHSVRANLSSLAGAGVATHPADLADTPSEVHVAS